MTAAHRRRRIKQTAARRRKPGWHGWVWLSGGLLVVLMVIWIIGSSVWGMQRRVEPLPEEANSHHFLLQEDAEWQRLLVLGMDKQGQVEQASVVSYSDRPESVGIVRLPVNLSDGQAILADYVKIGYYGEMQRMVERQIGLPLTGYVIERANETEEDWVGYLSGKKSIGWLSSTVGLPFWLGDLGSVQSSLDWFDFLQLIWLVREASVGNDELVVDVPIEAILSTRERAVTLDSELADRVLRPVYSRANFVDERITVEVKNATNVAGLAAMAGRYVTNMGGEVVATVAADTPASSSALTSDRESLLGQELGAYLGIPMIVKSRTGRERSDVEMVLGEDAVLRIGR